MVQALESLISDFEREVLYSSKQRQTLQCLSSTLESAELEYEKLVSDIYSGGSQRCHFKVGRFAAMIQTSNLLELVAETWVLDISVSRVLTIFMSLLCSQYIGFALKLSMGNV